MCRASFVFLTIVFCNFNLFAGWNIEVIDDGGMYSRLAVIKGQPAIAYQGYLDELKYARYNGSNWDFETVDNDDYVAGTALAVLPDGNPGIAYYEFLEKDLKYAWYDGAAWHNTIVESSGITGKFPSLAVIGGQPAISYFDDAVDDLEYARWDGSTWQITTVDAAVSIYSNSYTSLIALPDGNPAIAYCSGTVLKYAWFDGSLWQVQSVDTTATVGRFASMALLPSGRPAISYYDVTYQRLKYACLNGANTWEIVIVDDGFYSLNDFGMYNSLAILPNGSPAISYFDNYAGNLWFAWFDNGLWNKAKIDGNYESGDGYYSSLAVLPDHTLGISYHQDDNYILKMARTSTAVPAALSNVHYTATAWTARDGQVIANDHLAQSRADLCGEGSGYVSSHVSLSSYLPGNYAGEITLGGQACDSQECLAWDETTGECLEWLPIHEEPGDANGRLQVHLDLVPSPDKPLGAAAYLYLNVLLSGEEMGVSESMSVKIYRNGSLAAENIQEAAYVRAEIGDSLDVDVYLEITGDESYRRQADITIQILDQKSADLCGPYAPAPDGSVDLFDLVCLAENWLAADCLEPDFCGGADLNADQSVNLVDVALMSQDWLEGYIPTPPGWAKFYEETLDTDPGWTAEGLWEFGQPTGEGGNDDGGGPDPVAGYTGDNVYGYNLAGNYTDDLPETYLTSTPIDCTGWVNVQLMFWRWLGVEQSSYDHAYLQISNNGSDWVVIWENTSEVSDLTWKRIDIDISALADNQPTVYLRWTMGSTDDSVTYCGWNIDDVQLWGNP